MRAASPPCSSPPSARAAGWTEDYASALAKAKKEHKLLLLDFTGSDWCPWCKKFDAEVFATKKFQDFADRKACPRDARLSEGARAQQGGRGPRTPPSRRNTDVEGFPTLIVLDPDEKVVLKQEGFMEGGPEAFLALFPKPSS